MNRWEDKELIHIIAFVFWDKVTEFKIDQSKGKLENQKIWLNVVILGYSFLNCSINIVPSGLYLQWQKEASKIVFWFTEKNGKLLA